MNTLADRIRKMAESVDPELIASSLRIPLDIVKGILSGEIPDEILDSYDPGKPPELRVVEKKKYVHSKIIGVFSPGGCGATTVTALISLIASENIEDVLAIDLNEYGQLAYKLEHRKPTGYKNLLGFPGMDLEDLVVKTEGLSVVPGAPTVQLYQRMPVDDMATLISTASKQYELVVVDLPHTTQWLPVFAEECDYIIIVGKCDYYSIMSVSNIAEYLNMPDKLMVLCNQSGFPDSLTAAECKNSLRALGINILGVLPREPKLHSLRNCKLYENLKEIVVDILPNAGPKNSIKRKRRFALF